MTPELERNVQVAEEIQEKKNLLMLTRRQIALMIHAFIQIIDVRGKAKNMNDLLNIELVKKFDQAWEDTLMALEREPKADLFWKAFTIDSGRGGLSCKICLAKCRRATRV